MMVSEYVKGKIAFLTHTVCHGDIEELLSMTYDYESRIAALRESVPMNELSETVYSEMQRQWRRLKWQCDTWQRAEWRLTLDQYVAMWAPRWRDRRDQKLVLLRVDDAGAYEVGNVYIDTRTNQIKRQWALYRRQVERPNPGDDVILNVKCDETHIDTK